MQLGVFPYGVTFGDVPKVGKELKRIHHSHCEFTGRRDEGQWSCRFTGSTLTKEGHVCSTISNVYI